MMAPGHVRWQNHTGLPPVAEERSLLAIEAYTRRLLRHVQPIVVANRAPLSLQRADPIRGTPERLVRGGGGLVTAMSSVAIATHAGWIAAARHEEDRLLPAPPTRPPPRRAAAPAPPAPSARSPGGGTRGPRGRPPRRGW